jgi:NADP-dependent 3-hydroxy acid dehydrogenase YdfG
MATALELARRGYGVTLVARDAEALADATRAVQQCGADALTLAGDLADLQFAESVVASTVKRWRRVDLLVNNAADDASLPGALGGGPYGAARLRRNREHFQYDVAGGVGILPGICGV